MTDSPLVPDGKRGNLGSPRQGDAQAGVAVAKSADHPMVQQRGTNATAIAVDSDPYINFGSSSRPRLDQARRKWSGESPKTDIMSPGQILLGKYLVVRKLGQGGMGAVWLVKHLELDCFRALKLILSGIVDDEDMRARFRREAKAMASFSHPNAVVVHDAGMGHDFGFIEMEYVRGPSVDQLIELGRPMPLAWTHRVSIQLCEALNEAHSKKIIHRDLKPSNLMLLGGRPPGREFLKVLDFGLAKILKDAELDITQDGFVGTVSYASPEQVLGRTVDHRSDIYAVGVLLYEFATGRRPFIGSLENQFRDVVENMPTRPRSANPLANIPEPLEEIIMLCLAKRPEQRPQSAEELANLIASSLSPTISFEPAAQNQTVPRLQNHVDPKGATLLGSPINESAPPQFRVGRASSPPQQTNDASQPIHSNEGARESSKRTAKLSPSLKEAPQASANPRGSGQFRLRPLSSFQGSFPQNSSSSQSSSGSSSAEMSILDSALPPTAQSNLINSLLPNSNEQEPAKPPQFREPLAALNEQAPQTPENLAKPKRDAHVELCPGLNSISISLSIPGNKNTNSPHSQASPQTGPENQTADLGAFLKNLRNAHTQQSSEKPRTVPSAPEMVPAPPAKPATLPKPEIASPAPTSTSQVTTYRPTPKSPPSSPSRVQLGTAPTRLGGSLPTSCLARQKLENEPLALTTLVDSSGSNEEIVIAMANNSARFWKLDALEATAWRRFSIPMSESNKATRSFICNASQRIFVAESSIARIHDLADGSLVTEFREHTAPILAFAHFPQRDLALSGDSGQTVWVWNPRTGEALCGLIGHVGAVTAVAFNDSGRLAITGGSDRTVRLWDLVSGAELRCAIGHEGGVTALVSLPEVGMAASGGADGWISVWDLLSGTLVHRLKAHSSAIKSLALSQSGKQIASGAEDGSIRVWDVWNGHERLQFSGHTGAIVALAWSRGDQILASVGQDQTVMAWSLQSASNSSSKFSLPANPQGALRIEPSTPKPKRFSFAKFTFTLPFNLPFSFPGRRVR